MLRVDQSVALSFTPVLQETRHSEKKHDVNSHDAKDRSEDDVQVAVRETRKRAHTPLQVCCHQPTGTRTVWNKGWSGSILIAAAMKALLQEALCLRGLLTPQDGKVVACLQGREPNIQPQRQGEDGTDHNSVAVEFEEESICRRERGRDRETGGEEDEDCVDRGGWVG